jgi:hypothetical protein
MKLHIMQLSKKIIFVIVVAAVKEIKNYAELTPLFLKLLENRELFIVIICKGFSTNYDRVLGRTWQN